jgi:hypothetical protein
MFPQLENCKGTSSDATDPRLAFCIVGIPRVVGLDNTIPHFSDCDFGD